MRKPSLARPNGPRFEGQAAYLEAMAAHLLSHGISQATWGRKAGMLPQALSRVRDAATRETATRKQVDRLTDAANNLLAEHGDSARFAYQVRTIGRRDG